ncbi:MAG: MYXO-CTERM sorting domain-containing protein [Myxococcales bacterium]|nr:MYXO-CTERM sorting domain-containing protein [Myxococcales bacterium]
MNMLKTTIFLSALAGLAALPGKASAQALNDIGRADSFLISPASLNDRAPVRTGADGVERLRMTDEEHTNEQATIKFSADGTRALMVHMRTSAINEGTGREAQPQFRVQAALTALETFVQPDGRLGVRRPASAQFDIFATDNDGNEYRNAHKPELVVINGGKNVALFFNYQPNNDTIRYAKVFDWDLNPVIVKNGNGQVQKQVAIMAKNNDDCSMHQSGDGETGLPYYDQAGKTKLIMWAGCNGNGNDDGWANAIEFNCTNDAAGAATECQVKRLFDLSLAQREERSRGSCTVGAADKSFAVCTWTEGNTQPQRDGVWVAAVDLSEGGENGPNANSRLLWKERIQQRQTIQVNGEDREYYAMRAQHGRIMEKQPDGSLAPSLRIIEQHTLNRGANNNDKKGGRSDLACFAVMDTTRTGFTYEMPLSCVNLASPMLLGLDGTHISMARAVFGKGDTLMPGFIQLQGSQTGGLEQNGDIRTIGYDPVAKTMVNLGQHSANAPYDRHLYSNYLGNNPGNQGRNFAGCDLVKNPFFVADGTGATAASMVQFFNACALTGKASDQPASSIKPSAFVTLFPVAFANNAPDPQGGYNDNVPGDNTPDNPAPDEPAPFVPGSAAGGCSTGGGSSGGLMLLGLGLAALIRRRRK